MAVNINLASVVFTNLQTPTPWVSTQKHHTLSKRSAEPKALTEHNAQTVISAVKNEPTSSKAIFSTATGSFMDLRAKMMNPTSVTQTFSIVTGNQVIATFTAVENVASPPRGVQQPGASLPPWEIAAITICSALFSLLFIWVFVNQRRLEQQKNKMPAQELQSQIGRGDSTAQNQDTHDAEGEIAPKIHNGKNKIGQNTISGKPNNKYIPKDVGLETLQTVEDDLDGNDMGLQRFPKNHNIR